MAEGIYDALMRQNPVGGHQFFEDEIELAHRASPFRRAILWALGRFVNRDVSRWRRSAMRKPRHRCICPMTGRMQ
jgi:hypothetical protein